MPISVHGASATPLLNRCRSLGNRPAAVPSLRTAAWLRQDPVVKWTMLLDAGRNAHRLLAGDEEEDDGTVKKKSLRSSSNKMMYSSVGRRILNKARRWASAISCRVRGGSGNDDEGRKSAVSNKKSDTKKATTFRALPYDFRLRVLLSALMWIRSIRDVQDTIGREHVPYAEQRRIGRALCCRVYPMRMAERWVDGSITVDVVCGGDNESGEQIPPPHLWDVETATYIYDSVGERTISLPQSVGRGEVRKAELVARIKNLRPKPSADDEDGRFQEKMLLLPRMRRGGRLAPEAGGKSVVAARVGVNAAHRDMVLSSRPSPMWADPAMHAADEAYHRNALRCAGVPLDEHGNCAATSIHIECASVGYRPMKQSAALQPLDLTTSLVVAHAAVLSSLFVEGRPAHVTTNSPIVADYVSQVFGHIVSENFLSVCLCDNTDEQLEASEPSASFSSVMQYVPAWFFRHVVVVLQSSDAKSAAAFIRWCRPHCVMAEGGEAQLQALRTALMHDHEAACLKKQPSEESAESLWSSPWNLSSVLWTSLLPGDGVDDLCDHLKRGSSSAALFTALSSYRFISIVSSDTSAASRVARTVLQHFPLSTPAPVVAINYPATAALLYFPMAALLEKKLGNAFRYFHPERTVLCRSYSSKSVLGGTEVAAPTSGEGNESLLSCFTGGEIGESVKGSVLVLERSLEYLAEPCKYTMFTLAMAKWFRI
jgi:hypothetical protein